MTTSRTATSPRRSTKKAQQFSIYIVNGIDTDNDEIIGDLVPAISANDAIQQVKRARPYMTGLTAQTVTDHLKQAKKLAATSIKKATTDWNAFAAEQAKIYGDKE
jgi:uncharacterized protein YllA (UPF0747 family)